MSISFPTALDTLTNPLPTDKRDAPSHAEQHANANDAIEALEAKVGVNSSAVASSHDYKLSHLTASSLTDVTATATELNYVEGVTSSIQTQLDSKASDGANSDITSLSGLTTPLSVAQGGSGASTLTGLVKGNGTGAFTAVTAPSGTVVGNSDTQTLTNKTIAGGSNTISGITETMLSTSDITTLDVSTTKHGFVPKAPNDTDQFLRGDGTWAAPQFGYELLGSTTLGSDGDVINLTSFAQHTFLKIIAYLTASGQISVRLTFNNDTGSNYNYERTHIVLTDVQGSEQQGVAHIPVADNGGSLVFVTEIVNFPTLEKIGSLHSASPGGNAYTVVYQWTNSTDSITRVDITNGGSGSYATGSKLFVYGAN